MMLRCFALIVSCWASYALSAERVSVTIAGDNAYPPYSFEENGQLKGIYSDLIRSIAKRMESYDIKLIPLPWKRALLRVENGELPFVYPPYMRKKARPYLQYSDVLLEEYLVMFCHRTLMYQPRPKFPESYQGLRIGRNLGFLVGDNIIDAGNRGVIRLINTNDAATALRRIYSKKMDCYINDRLSVLYELKTLNEAKSVNPVALVEAMTFSKENAYLAASTDTTLYPYTQHFLAEFNRYLKIMKSNGELEAIIKNYTLHDEP